MMESSGASSSLRNRRFEPFLDIGSTVQEPSKIRSVEEEADHTSNTTRVIADYDEDGEDNSWIAAWISYLRIIACFITIMVTSVVWALIMVLLIPWPYARIKQGNVYGHVTGRLMMWILGSPIKIEGAEYSNMRAIYISNHASPIDIFLVMWLIPTGTVGIAKKEIIWYPLFGQIYALANHLRIDRSNPASAIESLKEAAHSVVKKSLSLIIFPEGTRSKTGRLLPFKKGFVHMALQTRLPIVPMVMMGTHRAWRKGSLHVRPAPLTIKYLPPIRTDEWTADKIDEYVKTVHAMFAKHLPEPQRPMELERKDSRTSTNS